jgi:hypothetical protein
MTEYLTAPVILALTGFFVAVIGAIAAGVAVIIKALHDVAVVVGKVETAVNSKASVAEGREIALQQKVVLLEAVNTDLKAQAALLAQAASHAVASVRGATRSTDPTAPLPVEVVNAPLLVEQTVAAVPPPITDVQVNPDA